MSPSFRALCTCRVDDMQNTKPSNHCKTQNPQITAKHKPSNHCKTQTLKSLQNTKTLDHCKTQNPQITAKSHKSQNTNPDRTHHKALTRDSRTTNTDKPPKPNQNSKMLTCVPCIFLCDAISFRRAWIHPKRGGCQKEVDAVHGDGAAPVNSGNTESAGGE